MLIKCFLSVVLMLAGTLATVTGEIPAWHPSLGYWQISHAPIAIACYRNGLRQITGSDFSISGTVITSKFWQSTDTLICDYSYLVTAN